MVAKRLLLVCAALFCLGPTSPRRAVAADQVHESVMTEQVAQNQLGRNLSSQAYQDSISRILQRFRGPDSTARARIPTETIVFDSNQVAEIVKGFDRRPYRIDRLTDTGEYEVHVSTPVTEAWKAHRTSKKRSKEPAILADAVEHRPLVTIQFIPKTRSIMWNNTRLTEYKASYESARLFRDSTEIEGLSNSKVKVWDWLGIRSNGARERPRSKNARPGNTAAALAWA